MDQTGMGEKPVEDAQRRYGEDRVEGVQFTGPTKLLLATEGKEAFEDRKVRVPLGDRDLRGDLHSLRKVDTPTAPGLPFSPSTPPARRAWCTPTTASPATPRPMTTRPNAGCARGMRGLGCNGGCGDG
jgi:hypothetical protein